MAGAVVWTTAHVGLKVSDIDRSVEFYGAVFGLQVSGRSDEPARRYAFLRDDNRLVLTLWEQSTEGVAARSAGLHHLSFEVESADELRAVEQRLREQQSTIFHDGIVAHSEGSRSGGVFFADPDGIKLEVYAADGGIGRTAPDPGFPTCGVFD